MPSKPPFTVPRFICHSTDNCGIACSSSAQEWFDAMTAAMNHLLTVNSHAFNKPRSLESQAECLARAILEMNQRQPHTVAPWDDPQFSNEGNPAHGETPKLPAKEKSETSKGEESLPSEEA